MCYFDHIANTFLRNAEVLLCFKHLALPHAYGYALCAYSNVGNALTYNMHAANYTIYGKVLDWENFHGLCRFSLNLESFLTNYGFVDWQYKSTSMLT